MFPAYWGSGCQFGPHSKAQVSVSFFALIVPSALITKMSELSPPVRENLNLEKTMLLPSGEKQLEALREYAAQEGYEVLEEVQDPGQSGAMLARPPGARSRA